VTQLNLDFISSPSWSTDTPGAWSNYSVDAPLVSSVPNAKVQFTSPFTIAAWIKRTAIDSTGRYWLCKDDGLGTNDYAIISGFGAGTNFALFSSNDNYIAQIACPDTNWNHYAFTYDGTDVVAYMNGSVDSTTTITLTMNVSSGPVVVGSYLSGTFPGNGNLDDVVLVEQCLDATAIASLFAGTIPTFSTEAAVWKFEEGSGSTAYDSGYTAPAIVRKRINSRLSLLGVG